jgi:hypothetical protein
VRRLQLASTGRYWWVSGCRTDTGR